MPLGLLKDIAEYKPEAVRLLGLDVGKKTIGLALSNPEQTLATPHKTIQRTKFTKDILELQKVINDYEIGGFVIGFPINMDETEGPRCQAVRDFALELIRYPQIVGTNPWIALWDERFSTVSAENFVDGFVDKRKAKDKGVLDMLAAQIILQSALDYVGNLGGR